VACEVEDAELVDRLGGEVTDDLGECADHELLRPDLPAPNRVNTVTEVDVVRDPWPVLVDDLVAAGFQSSARSM
jgi:hypothetical protein